MTILVNNKQRGNPLLSQTQFFVKYEDQVDPSERGTNGIPYKNEDMVEDYLVNKSISVLFLSLKYHKTYPKYIQERLSKLFTAKGSQDGSFC